MDAFRLLRRALPFILLAAAAGLLLRRRAERPVLPAGPLPAPELPARSSGQGEGWLDAEREAEDRGLVAVAATGATGEQDLAFATAEDGQQIRGPVGAEPPASADPVEQPPGSSPSRFGRRPIDIVTVVDDLLGGGR